MFGFIKFVFSMIFLVLIVVVLYAALFAFDYMPTYATPDALMPEQYKYVKAKLFRDGYSTSPTAEASKAIYNFLRDKEKAYAQKQVEEEKAAAEAERAKQAGETGSAMDRAQQAVDDYNSKMQDRQNVLDEL